MVLAHIKAGHVLYTLIARNIGGIIETIGQATLGIGALLGQGIAYALLEWYRKAELEFLRQIRIYEDEDRSELNRAYKFLLTLERTHPFAILRAKELDEWHQDGYRELMNRRGVEVDEPPA